MCREEIKIYLFIYLFIYFGDLKLSDSDGGGGEKKRTFKKWIFFKNFFWYEGVNIWG